MQKQLLSAEDIKAIRAKLAAENPKWEIELTDAELEGMAEEALDGSASEQSERDSIRRSVVRTASQVLAEFGVGA